MVAFKKGTTMTSLRKRMIQDMVLAGYKPSTQDGYIRQVRYLAEYYHCPPDRITEKQVRNYFLYLREEKKVARGTFQNAYAAIRFFFYMTLDRDWSLFSKKRWRCHSKNGCLMPGRTRRCEHSSGRFATRSIVRVCARCMRAVCV